MMDLVDDLMGMSLMMHGKGKKDRLVPLTDRLTREIGKLETGWLFPGDVNGHICADTVYLRVREATGWPPHALRRRFATAVWKATGDLLKSPGTSRP